MSDMRGLAYAMNKFLTSEISEGRLPEDKVEAVETCIKNLEAAYNIGSSEPDLDVPLTLQDIFQKCLLENEPRREATSEMKLEANKLQDEGNRLMDWNNFKGAVECYTKAIDLDPTNPKFYCSRAAAWNSLGEHEEAIRDCEKALCLDPENSKAFCRLGHTLSKLSRFRDQALRCFKRAVELEPKNERYRAFLRDAERPQAETKEANRQVDLQSNDSVTVGLNVEVSGQPGVLADLVRSLWSVFTPQGEEGGQQN